jgi:hypothetical protein
MVPDEGIEPPRPTIPTPLPGRRRGPARELSAARFCPRLVCRAAYLPGLFPVCGDRAIVSRGSASGRFEVGFTYDI